MSTAIKFKNFTNEDFTWSFDSVAYTFKANQEMYLEDYKAQHFAKHLIDRELNKTNTPTNSLTAREALLKQCFPSDEVVTPIQAIDIEARKAEEAKEEVKTDKKKPGRPSKKAEEEFVDLQ